MASADILRKGNTHANTFLDFDISETQPWSYGVTAGVQDMIGEIVHLKRKYPEDSLNKETVRNFRDDFIFQMSLDDGVGIQNKEKMVAASREDIQEPVTNVDGNVTTNTDDELLENKNTKNENLETKNMLKAWRYFESLKQSTNDSVLSVDLVLEGHRILMKDLIKNPGQFAEGERYTTCPVSNEKVDYPTPSFVAKVCPTLLDYANYIACYLRERLNKDGATEDIVSQIVKFCAWFFASFIQLHPFSDGNGRMSRLLYFYIQSLISPFAVGVYNINAPTQKMDYMKAICIVREENKQSLENEENEFRQNNWKFDSKPRDLARMILECQWYAWRHFDDKQKQQHSYKRQLTTELLTPESLEDYNKS